MGKPILFNTEMVKAILECRKTTTRRVVKPQPTFVKQDVNYAIKEINGVPFKECNCFCKKGDTLWVRETWCRGHAENGDNKTIYKADIETDLQPIHTWKPSIHMSRKYARLFLKVTDMRVERLQDITEDGARKEGCFMPSYSVGDGSLIGDSVTWFKIVWNNCYNNWNDNPRVWVIEFERMV